MPYITSQNVANAMTKLIAADALPTLLDRLVMGNLVYRNFEPVVARAGDTVSVLTAGGIEKEVRLDSHVEATFQIPDVTKVLAVPDLLKIYMEPAMGALAEKIELDLLVKASAFKFNTFGPLSDEALDQAETALFNARVPPGAQKYLVVDAVSYATLRRHPRFNEYSSSQNAGLRTFVDGNVGRLKDFYVFRSPFVRQRGTPPTTFNLAFTKDALGFVMRRLPQPLPGTGAIGEYAELGNFGIRVVMSYNPDTLSQQITIDILYGIEVLRPEHGVLVHS